jgi:hypothetical protein
MEIRTSGGDKWCQGIVMNGGCCYEISTCVFPSPKDMCLKVCSFVVQDARSSGDE